MAGEEQGANWPLPKFYFSVDLGGPGRVPFQEVTGLNTPTTPIEYRAGSGSSLNAIKMPGLINTGNVTLKKGIFLSDNVFFDWMQTIKLNTIKRQTVTINLLDQTAKPTMVWKLSNAWPTKISGIDLKSDGNEVAVELVELAHEALTIQNAG